MFDINPTSLASQLAAAYTQPAQNTLDAQTKSAQATSSGLTKLQSALQAFQTAFSSLGGKNGMLKNALSFNQTGFGSGTASTTAQAGTYSVFVEKLATANQVAFDSIPSDNPASGTLSINLSGGSGFSVDLSTADQDLDTKLSPTELARAINTAANNTGLVNAMVATANGSTQLILSAASTGADSRITVDTSAMPAGTLADALAESNRQDLALAADAIIWLGAKDTGLQVQQASNTFTAIQGVSLTFTQAQAAGATPLSITVSRDDSGTAGNVRSFIDAYNALEKTLNELTSTGNAKEGVAAATFASDAGIRALRSRLHSLIRQDFGGFNLRDFGVSSDRKGTLSLDESKMQKKLATSPDGLDQLFGSNSIAAPSGLLGEMGKMLTPWTNSVDGHVKRRRDTVDRMQQSLGSRQTRLDSQYAQAYDRYLRQFSQMQALQEQMNQNTGLLGQIGL